MAGLFGVLTVVLHFIPIIGPVLYTSLPPIFLILGASGSVQDSNNLTSTEPLFLGLFAFVVLLVKTLMMEVSRLFRGPLFEAPLFEAPCSRPWRVAFFPITASLAGPRLALRTSSLHVRRATLRPGAHLRPRPLLILLLLRRRSSSYVRAPCRTSLNPRL